MPACFIRENRLVYFCLLKEAFSKMGKKSRVVKATVFLLRGGRKVLGYTLSHWAGHLQSWGSAMSCEVSLHTWIGGEAARFSQFRSFSWAQDCWSEAGAILLSPKCLLICQTDKAFFVHYVAFILEWLVSSFPWCGKHRNLISIVFKLYTSSKHG